MKRILTRMAALALLVMATFWFGTDTQAKKWGCADSMFAAQSACDDTLSGTIGSYNNVTNFSPNQCDNQAQVQCGSNSTCYNNTYNNCYNSAVNNYGDRYNAYGSCVGGTINYSCYEEPDFCAAARDRANQCAALYPYEPGVINTAQMECRGASGIDQCQ